MLLLRLGTTGVYRINLEMLQGTQNPLRIRVTARAGRDHCVVQRRDVTGDKKDGWLGSSPPRRASPQKLGPGPGGADPSPPKL